MVIRPRRTWVSDSWCFGVTPAQQASWPAWANRVMSPISATKTAPKAGPIPGICWAAASAAGASEALQVALGQGLVPGGMRPRVVAYRPLLHAAGGGVVWHQIRHDYLGDYADEAHQDRRK